MKNLKLKSVLLSSAAAFAVVAAFSTTGSVAGNKADSELSAVQNLVDSVASNGKKAGGVDPNSLKTKTPIKHLVVVFNENRSFDHYFATYPNAINPEGEPIFEPAKNSPRDINNLISNAKALIDNNPNGNPNVVPSNGQTVTQPSNGANAAPSRSVSTALRSTLRARTTTIWRNRKPMTPARTTCSRWMSEAVPLVLSAPSAPRAR